MFVCLFAFWMHQEGMKHYKTHHDSSLLNSVSLQIVQKLLTMASEAFFRTCPLLTRPNQGSSRTHGHTQLRFWREFNEGPLSQGVGRAQGLNCGGQAARNDRQWEQRKKMVFPKPRRSRAVATELVGN